MGANQHGIGQWSSKSCLAWLRLRDHPRQAIIAGATSGPDDSEPAASLNMPPPEPVTLGPLAMGAPGLSIWRRKESVGAIASSS
jgi:hypothetical protein